MKKTLGYAFLLAGMIPLLANAHVGYGGRNFGTFGDIDAISTIPHQATMGNYGWIDGTDSDYGDSHNLRAYRFTLDEPATVRSRSNRRLLKSSTITVTFPPRNWD